MNLLTDSTRRYRWLQAIIRRGPRWIAQLFMEFAARHEHIDSPRCLPCAVIDRKTSDAHTFTVGPRSNYCSKCGLDVSTWPEHCANRVVKVNNPPPRKGFSAFVHRLLWD